MRRIILVVGVVFSLPFPGLSQVDGARDDFNLAAGLHDRGLHDRATKAFEDFLKNWPQDARRHKARFYLAQSLAESGHADRALPAYLAYVASGETELLRPARLRAGELLSRASRHAEAIPLLIAGAADDGDKAMAEACLYNLAESQSAAGDKPAAKASYVRLIEAYPGGTHAAYAAAGLGFLCVDSGDTATALKAFEFAVNRGQDPELVIESSVMRGECLVRLDRHDDAVKVMQDLLAKGCGKFEVQSRLILARAWIAKRDGPKVVATLRGAAERATRSDAVNATLIQSAAKLNEIGKREEAVAVLDLLVAPTPKEATDADYWRGVILSASDVGSGLASLERAAKASDATPRRRFAYGDALAKSGKHAEALVVFAALRQDGADPVIAAEAAYAAAYSLAKLERREEAIKLLEPLSRQAPTPDLQQDATFALAENLFGLKRFEPAEAAYAQLIDQPGKAHREEALYKAAWCEYSLGRWDPAAGILRGFIAEYGSGRLGSEARYLLGKCHEGAGRSEAARQVFSDLAKEAGRSEFGAKALLGAAAAARREGHDAEALAAYAEVLRSNPPADLEAEARIGTADLLHAAGKFAEAEAAYGKLIERLPDHPLAAAARLGQAWAMRESGKNDAAIAAATKVAESTSDARMAGEAWYLVAVSESALGRHELTIAAAQRVTAKVADHPRAEEAAMLLGSALVKASRVPEAVTVLRKLSTTKNRTTAAAAIYELAFALETLGETAARDAEFERLVRQHADSPLACDATFRIAESLYVKEEWAAALARYDAVAAHPQAGDLIDKAAYKAAWCCRRMERSADAQRRFDAVSRLESPLAAESCWLAGEEAEKAGDPTAAESAFRRLRTSAPEHELARDAGLRIVLVAAARQDADVVIREGPPALRAGGDPARVLQVQSAVGDAFFAKKSWSRARTAFEAVTKASEGPLAARAQYQIGRTHAEAGEDDAAIDALLKVTILYAHKEWQAKATLMAANLLEKVSQLDKARKLYEEVRRDHAGTTEAEQAADRLRALAK